MAAVVSARNLLLEVRNDFNSCVDADSLIAVFDLHKMLKKKDKKFLGRPGTDESTKNTLLYHTMYNSEETSTPLSATDVIRLLEETKNERNILFSKTMQSILSTIAKAATASLPPFKYHPPLDDNPSAIFSSSGGVLYSPVYGVTVYIPAGAILGEEQVEVSFRLAKEEAEIQELLSRSLFEGSVVCSSMFEFEAKLVNAPDGKEFTQFHSDVWIELPHCLSFGGYSLKDYSTAFVISERRGKVEVEEQALFSDGYPYVNLPVRHFSRFCATHTPKRRFAAMPNLRKAMQKLSISNSFDDNNSASPRALSKLQKQVSEEAAAPSTATKRRALDYEMRKASSEASAEEQRQGLVRQDASDLHDGETMEIDQPTQVGAASNTPLQQESLNAASMSIMAQVYQPRKRHRMHHWRADIVFAPHLHSSYKVLADFREECQFECCTTVFRLELRTVLIQLQSSHSNQGWSVELSTMKILLEHLEKVASLLNNEPKSSSKMAAFLPSCTATVQNHETFLPLRHPIEVERSDPPTCCYLTCEPVLDEADTGDQTLHCSQRHAQHDLMSSPSGSTQDPSPSGSTQDPSPSRSTQDPSPSGSTQDPSPSGSTQGPNPSGSTHGPSPSGSTQGPNPSGSTHGPSPSGSTQGPNPSGSTQDPNPSGSTQDLNPSGSTQIPSPSGSTQGPRLSDCTHGPSPSSSTLTGSTPSSFPSAPFPPRQRATIQWDRDRYVLAPLSIMIPEGHLAALGESLGLPRLTIDQVLSSYSSGSSVSVGERAYEMFRRASKSEQPLTFGKIFVALNKINRSDDLIPILRSYLQSFNMATSGTPLEGDDSIPNRFFVWLRVNHPTLIPLCDIEEKRTISPGHSEQDSLFLYLSPKLVCVWRMVGRLLGLTDSDIEAIDTEHKCQQDRESESCYQMLLKWVKHSQRPSDITYYRLMAALQLTSRGAGAALDAIFYLRNFVLNVTGARH